MAAMQIKVCRNLSFIHFEMHYLMYWYTSNRCIIGPCILNL